MSNPRAITGRALLAALLFLVPLLHAAVPVTAAGDDDCGSGRDAGNSEGTAIELTGPVLCQGTFEGTDMSDFYKIHLEAGTGLKVVTQHAGNLDTDICFYGPGARLAGCRLDYLGPDQYGIVTDAPGHWVILVARGEGWGTYTLTLDLPPAPAQDDCGTGIDAHSIYPGAAAPPLNTECAGELNEVDELDRYALNFGTYMSSPNGGPDVQVAVQTATANAVEVCLYRPSGHLVDRCRASTATGTAPAPIRFVIDDTGNWLLTVRRHLGTPPLTYSLGLTTTPAPAQNDCAIPGDAPNSVATPRVVPAGSRCQGVIRPADKLDAYRFHIEKGDAVSLQLTATNPLQLCLQPAGSYARCVGEGTRLAYSGSFHLEPGHYTVWLSWSSTLRYSAAPTLSTYTLDLRTNTVVAPVPGGLLRNV